MNIPRRRRYPRRPFPITITFRPARRATVAELSAALRSANEEYDRLTGAS